MTTKDTFASDLRALGASTLRDLPPPAHTALALDRALASRARARSSARKPVLVAVGACAVAAGALLVPVPYQHQVGWDVTLRARDGHVATLHVSARNGEEAERRATALGRSTGAAVTVAARMELVWGSFYAFAKERLLHIQVDMDGKTDAEVAQEIRAQLDQQGWTPGAVVVERSGDSSSVSMGADDGEGRHVEVVQKKDGPGANRIQIKVDPIDDTREPGMTDEQLRDKILAQLKARGMDAEVVVQGDRVEIRAQKTVEGP